MKETKSIPVGIMLFIVFIIILDVVYLYYLVYYLLFVEGYLTAFFTFPLSSLLMWTDVLLTTSSLFVIPYGFLNGRNWARIFAFVFILWSAFWAITMIITRKEIIIHYLLFVIYVVLIMYLLMSHVKTYFGKTNGPRLFHDRDRAYHYGEYTLYTRDVKLRSGRTQTIYFFSKRTLDTGRPCSKPDGYIIGVNQKTGMPYLKKKR